MGTWPSPILYSDADGEVVLLDGPASISFAQHRIAPQELRQLNSAAAATKPYAVPEPRTKAAAARVQERLAALADATPHVDLIVHGLDQIRRNYQGPWCLPRRTVAYNGTSLESCSPIEQPDQPAVSTGTASRGFLPVLTLPPPPENSQISTSFALTRRVVCNPHDTIATIQIAEPAASYLVPAGASFILTSLSSDAAGSLSRLLLAAAPEPSSTLAPGQFDMVVLDPPWANRSARRTVAYRRARSNDVRGDPFCGLQEMLAAHLAPECVVACWVTHASAVRAEVEGAFEEWGLTLAEEWTWAKITQLGEPIVPLDSTWRRSWEVLLVGRRYDGKDKQQTHSNAREVKRRLLVGVPDVHSRKPCLKALFERFGLVDSSSRVLEVFARNLVAGWCSVGDEATKYNWAGHWSD